MATYPIHVPRDPYRGRMERRLRQARQRDAIAAELETYINDRFRDSDDESHSFMYGYIAIDTGIPEDTVRRLLFGVDCGHNGLTVYKKKR